MIRFLSLFAVLGATLSYSAFAEDTPAIPDIPKPLKVMPSKIKPFQSGEDELSKAAPETMKSESSTDNIQLESLSPRALDSFQGDLSDEFTRAEINKILSKESKVSSSSAARKLALKLALTPFLGMSVDAKYPENIYGLRLNQFLNLGSLDDAEKLYKLNEFAPPSALAARAGIEAMVGSGQIAVACLDQKTFDENLKSDAPQFWSNVNAFCQALLGPVAGDDDELRLANASRAYLEISKPAISTPNDLNKLDAVTTIAVSKTGRLNNLITSSSYLSKIDDKHLALLFKSFTPTPSSLPLVAEGLKRGIVNSSQAIVALKSVNSEALTQPSPYTEYLNEYFKTPDTPMVTAKLLELAVTNSVKEALLYPLYTASEIAFPDSNKLLSLRLLALTNQDLPINLVRSAYKFPIDIKNNGESGELLLINSLFTEGNSPDKSRMNAVNATLFALKYANYPQKDVKNAYDNILSLTPSGNYVMHNDDILSSLKESADKKQMNQVVIRSLAIIDDKPLEKLHPAELYRVLEALNSVGLTEETMLLTREVLGNIIKN